MGMDGTLSPVWGWDGTSHPTDPFANSDPLGFEAGDANLYRYVGNSPTNAIDPSGLAEIIVRHITRPESVASILRQGFVPREAGLTFFAGEGSGSGFPPKLTAERSAALNIRIDDSCVRALPEALEKEAEAAASKGGLTPRKWEWWTKKWEYIMEKGGPDFKNGFKYKDANGWHYALTKEGLKAARPTLISGTSNVIKALLKNAERVKPASELAAGKWGARAGAACRVGGRILVPVGIAADLYEIYTAEDRTRAVVKSAGGWAGAIAGAWALGKLGAMGGAAAGAPFAGVGAGPGAFLGGAGGAFAGAVGGFWGGRTITEITYDYFFSPGVPIPVPD